MSYSFLRTPSITSPMLLLLLGAMLLSATVSSATDISSLEPAGESTFDLLHSGRQLNTLTCGDPGQACCKSTPQSAACTDASAVCVQGTCKLPCGGLHMHCCDGSPELDDSLNFSGSSGSRMCNRILGLVCSNKQCVPCGNLGQPCCMDTQACQQPGTTCDAKTSACVACGGMGKRCCEGGPPCNNLAKNYCHTSRHICVPRQKPPCGGNAQRCCPGKSPCKVAKSLCVKGRCKGPCGGLNMRCCHGFEGALDFSGSSGSRSCERRLGVSCYKDKCRRCGKKGQPCCYDSGTPCEGYSTCNFSLGTCVGCGALGQGCCAYGPPCVDLEKHICSSDDYSSGKCVIRS